MAEDLAVCREPCVMDLEMETHAEEKQATDLEPRTGWYVILIGVSRRTSPSLRAGVLLRVSGHFGIDLNLAAAASLCVSGRKYKLASGAERSGKTNVWTYQTRTLPSTETGTGVRPGWTLDDASWEKSGNRADLPQPPRGKTVGLRARSTGRQRAVRKRSSL